VLRTNNENTVEHISFDRLQRKFSGIFTQEKKISPEKKKTKEKVIPLRKFLKKTNAILRYILQDNKNVVNYALGIFASSSLDFVDCLLVAYAKEEQYAIFTFDKKLQKYLP
jgi:predicted nucleic acid-binding protein